MKIPGLSHEAVIRYDGTSGVSMIELRLRGDVIASTPLKAASESGIAKGLSEVAKMAEILHQIPDSILKDLAKKLSVESGYVEAPGGSTKAAGASSGELSPEVEEKLNLILSKLDQVMVRLKSIEEKWG
jgi:hypothetical protein